MDSKKRKTEENGAEQLTPEDVRSLIEPFVKEQLLDILQEAAVRHEDVLDGVRKLADRDPTQRKLFVRGLGRDTAMEDVKSVFSQYGEVDEVVVIVDKATGHGKGYGFVTFAHVDGVQRALKEPSKKIDGRIAVCHLASLGNAGFQPSLDHGDRKIYVGSVPFDVTSDKLLSLFSKYGEIEEGPYGFDKQTGKSRGYALIVYRTAEGAKRALEEPIKMVAGHQVHCKRAASDAQKKPLTSQGQFEGIDLAALQAAGGAASSLGYGALSLNPAMNLAGLHPALAAQGLHSGLSANQSLAGFGHSLNPSVVQQLASSGHSFPSSLNSSIPSSLYASLTEGGSHGLTSLGIHSLGAYGSRAPQSAYGASLYGVPSSSVASQSGVLQGAGGHTLASLQASQLAHGTGSRLHPLSSYYST